MNREAMKLFLCVTLAFGGVRVALAQRDAGDIKAFHPMGNNGSPPPPAPAPVPVSPANTVAPTFTKEWRQGDMLYRTYQSPELWSGEGKNFSEWYTLTSSPAPEGYRIASTEFHLQGDRACAAWAECQPAGQDATTATWRFRMQGHDERFPTIAFDSIDGAGIHFVVQGRKATSKGILTVGYVQTTTFSNPTSLFWNFFK